MNLRSVLVMTALTAALTGIPGIAGADSALNSPHNLSASGPGRITAPGEERVCIFCHNVHHAATRTESDYPGPLWGRQENATSYTPYDSPSLVAKPGQPLGPSRLCLSCHDGTIALGAPAAHGVKAVLPSLASYPPPSTKPSAVLGTNLGDEHPISMEYARDSREFRSVSELRLNNVKLVERGGTRYVECTSCHDPHDNRYGNFLVVDTGNQKDALCTACHNRTGWTGSAHHSGGDRYPVALADEVAKKGCVSCHVPHSAQRPASLLVLPYPGAGLDTNCYVTCHNGTPPYSDLPAQFNPAGRYTHPLTADAGSEQHGSSETLPMSGGAKHVHCVDCHNPHQASWQDAPLAATRAPLVDGPLKAVRGVTVGGETIEDAPYEYQICFRCHSGPAAAAGEYSDPLLAVERQYNSLDLRERFNTATTRSAHPVTDQRAGTGRSLLANANTNWIYCTSCHDAHGSVEPHMLRAANPETYSSLQGTSFPLCYSCHDESYLMNSAFSAALHKSHVFGLHQSGNMARTSCSVCHDPHGVPYQPAMLAGEGTHLVNFDLRYVPPGARYDANGFSCSIQGAGGAGFTCHPAGVTNPAVYSPYPFMP